MSGAHSTHGPSADSPPTRRRWWIAAVYVGVVYAMGAYGLRLHGLGWLDALYGTFQMFFFEPPHLEKPLNWWIEGGRWGALLFGLAAVMAVAWMMVGQEFARSRFWRARGHLVVCAPAHHGQAIAGTLRQRYPSSAMAIIRTGHGAQGVVKRIARRTVLFEGDVPALLSAVAASSARIVVIAGDDDEGNLAAAASVCAAAAAHRTDPNPLACHVQIRGGALRESLRRATTLPASRSYIHCFDLFESAARRLLRHDLPIDGEGIAATDHDRPHLIIVGGGEWALTVAAAAARLGHFANGRLLRLSIIPDDVQKWHALVAHRFAALPELVEYDVRSERLHVPESGRWLRQAARDGGGRVSVVIAADNDRDAVELSDLARRPLIGTGASMAVRVGRTDLHALVRHHSNGDKELRLLLFGAADGDAWRHLVDDDEREEMAKLVQLRFVQLGQSDERRSAMDRAVNEWRTLADESYRDANRQQVDHIYVKLRAIGCELAPRSDRRAAADWSPDEVMVLARMEHQRWVAERRMAGWSYAPGPKNEVDRTSPYLVPWEELPDEIREYDRDAVRGIPALVEAAAGLKVCRRARST